MAEKNTFRLLKWSAVSPFALEEVGVQVQIPARQPAVFFFFSFFFSFRPNTTYIDTLKRDTGAFEASEIAALMADKRQWKDLAVARLRATK